MSTPFIAYLLSIVTLFLIYTILVIALNLQWGQAGIMNFGIAGFFALGAYVTAICLVDPSNLAHVDVGLNLPYPVALLIAATFTGVIAWLISPLVKLGIEELAIITLAFSEFIMVVIQNEEWLTGGTMGINIPSVLDKNLDLLGYNIIFTLILVVLVLLMYYFTRKLNFSQFGRILNSIRQDEIKAKSLGFDTVSYRVKAFIIGSVLMAIAGSIYIYFTMRAVPGLYGVGITFTVWIALILGGSGNNLGAILGMGIYFIVDTLAELYLKVPGRPEIAASLPFILLGLLLIVVIIRRPQGILGPKRSRYG